MKNCRICKKQLKKIISLGSQPLANNLNKKINEKQKKYRLNLNICTKCKTMQHDININLNTLYKNYFYSSSVSKDIINNSKKLSNFFKHKLLNIENKNILEIGCNDGYMLQFLKKDFNVCGVEPSKNHAKICKEKGINVINDYFNYNTARKIKRKYGKFSIIIANNVLAHKFNINSIIKSIYLLLDDKGFASVELQDSDYLLKNGLFDMIYHEHFFYFNKYSFTNLLNKNNFKLISSKYIKTHGRSIRFIFKKSNDNFNKYYFNKNNIQIFLNKINKTNYHVKKFFSENSNKKIVIFGAAAKTTVFINYFKLFNEIMYVIDDTEFKINKFIPNTNIKILSEKKLLNIKPDFIIIGAWNYSNFLYKKLVYTKKWGCKFINFFPKFSIR